MHLYIDESLWSCTSVIFWFFKDDMQHLCNEKTAYLNQHLLFYSLI